MGRFRNTVSYVVTTGAVVVVGVSLLGYGPLASPIRAVFFRAKGTVAGMASARPPTADPQAAAQCRQNLDRIQNAKRKAAETRGNNIGGVTWNEIVRAMHPNDPRVKAGQAPADLIPKCPAGGTYELGTMQELVKCSIGGNFTAESADDHVIVR